MSNPNLENNGGQMNEEAARRAADTRLRTMIRADKIRKWKIKIQERLNPRFDGTLNVNVLPVSEDPRAEVIADICRQASSVAAGLYLEDIIPLCNRQFKRSKHGSGHDINIPKICASDVKMSTETVKKGDKTKVSRTLVEKCEDFEECFWVEFFGKAKTEIIDGVAWYSGAHAHRKLGLNEDDVAWISRKVFEFRKLAFQMITQALD